MTRRVQFIALTLALLLGPGILGMPGIAAAQDQPSGPAASAEEPATEVKDVIVVTASRTEQKLHEVAATVTVLDAEQIEQIPMDDYGDLLRNVPGLNVSQMSARDVQITGRSSTNSLATTELVLLDNRSIYLDFFGFVMWDFLPVNPSEIKQIEVVRGPGSAVWGANALSGVINLITKRPREMVGTTLLVGAGELGTAYGSLSHAGVSGKLGYKFSAGYYEQDPYPRPTGAVPDANPATTYPDFQNEGTAQPKGDLRFDYDISDESTWSFAAGYAGTDGIVHSGIGPFAIDSGSSLAYAKTDWTRQAFRISAFVNLLDADSANLLSRGADGNPLAFAFQTDTYNLDLSNTTVVGQHNVFTYGANARTNSFELEIASQAPDRDELGVFVQDEILIGDKVRWLIGARWDDIDPIGSVVTPRTSLVFAPSSSQSFRLSYNQAFRAPSTINNYLDTAILAAVPGLPTGTFVYPIPATGNVALEEEKLTAYEVGWVGTFGATTVTLSAYRNEIEDSIDFFQTGVHTSTNPPPGWPLPPIFLDFPPLAGALPSGFSYRNVGQTVDRGVELSFNGRPTTEWSWFVNYSWQDEPEVTGIPEGETNIPPENRLNAGLSFDSGRFFVNSNVNFADDAYWADVLNIRAPTDGYTMVNLGVGVRFANERVTLSVLGSNIFDEEVQQHIFGDIITRKVVGQLQIRF